MLNIFKFLLCIGIVLGTISGEESNSIDVDSANLLKHKDCEKDLKAICGKEETDLEVLFCVLNQGDARINDACGKVLMEFAEEFTKKTHIIEYLKGQCKEKEDQDVISNCEKPSEANDELLECMKSSTTLKASCAKAVDNAGRVVFSHYKFIGSMVGKCDSDIVKFKCDEDTSSNVPGMIIKCLSEHLSELEPGCHDEIEKIGREQSKVFEWDAALREACQHEQSLLCGNAKHDQGVIVCLLRHKNDPSIGKECGEQLDRRVKMVWESYDISSTFKKACGEYINEHHCADSSTSEVKDEKQLKTVLQCLHKAQLNGAKIVGECHEIIMTYRTIVLNDAPSLITGCKQEIQRFCSDAKDEEKLHCLIGHFQTKGTKADFSAVCERAIEEVIAVANPSEDWEVDKVLHEACMPVYNKRCSGIRAGKGRVMDCLMDGIDSDDMVEECKTALIEIGYFASRDWRLNPSLYSNCRKDAVQVCSAADDWGNPNRRVGPENTALVMSCLFRHAFRPTTGYKLTKVCENRVRHVMEERAAHAELLPEVERECFEPLTTLCSEETGPGEEVSCLRKNYESLEGSCKEWIKSFIVASEKRISFSIPLKTYCEDYAHQYCMTELKNEDGYVFDCLVQHKFEIEKDSEKCFAVIENFQIVTLRDPDLSPKFQKACLGPLEKFCSETLNTNKRKDQVNCLAQTMLHDKLTQESTLDLVCAKQLQRLLTERHAGIKFDLGMQENCAGDVEKFCSNIHQGSAKVLACLRHHKNRLSVKCHEVVFKRGQMESAFPKVDRMLMKNCKAMIVQYCSEVKPVQWVSCLWRNREEAGFDGNCLELVNERMEEKSSDLRMNPVLYQACNDDANKHCSQYLSLSSAVERDGKVIDCLKSQLPERNSLKQDCRSKLIEFARRAALDYKLDPVLNQKCTRDIKVLCSSEELQNSKKGEMEDCLKLQFENDKLVDEECKAYVAALMNREKADIHLDPALFRACIVDDGQYCMDMERGKHLACLFDILERNPNGLSVQCRKKLRERREMFGLALKYSKLETVEDLVKGVQTSHNRDYLLVVLGVCIFGIFVFGLMFGRLTKRRYKLLKNK